MNTDTMFSSKNQFWCTPQAFFDKLDAEFHFTLDPCATAKSAKCAKFYTPEQDGLKQSWAGETVFCNPPYGRSVGIWIHKCLDESCEIGTIVVMLIAGRPDTKAWQDTILPYATEIRWVRGRIKFTDEDGNPKRDAKGRAVGAPFPSAVVVFGSKA